MQRHVDVSKLVLLALLACGGDSDRKPPPDASIASTGGAAVPSRAGGSAGAAIAAAGFDGAVTSLAIPDDVKAAGDGPALPELQFQIPAFARALCARLGTCCASEWNDVLGGLPAAQCVDILSRKLFRELLAVDRAILAGDVTFSATSAAASAERCLAGLTARGCETFTAGFPEGRYQSGFPYSFEWWSIVGCGELFAPTRAVGAPCTLDVACKQGRCLRASATSQERRCTTVAGEDQLCSQSGPFCADDLYCRADVCRKRVGNGEVCGLNGGDCAVDSYCDTTDVLDQRCRSAAAPGSACTATCTRGHACMGPFDARTCRPLIANGQPCEFSEWCQSGHCAESPGATKACAARPLSCVRR